MKSTGAIFASIFSSAVAMPTSIFSFTPDLVMTNYLGPSCASLLGPSVLTSAVATVSDTCTSRGRKRAR